MTLLPSGIEIFRVSPPRLGVDRLDAARLALHRKLVGLSDAEAILTIPHEELVEQVGVVVDELLGFENFNLSQSEQDVLSRVLAFDLIEIQGRNALISRAIN